MYIVNELYYPFLKLYNPKKEVLWTHPIFNGYAKQVKDKKTLMEHSELLKKQGFDETDLKEISYWKYTLRMSPEELEKVPMFAVHQNDFESFSRAWGGINEMIGLFWSEYWCDCIPEIVTADLYDTAFDKRAEDVEKMVKGKSLCGVTIRPREGILVAYVFDYESDIFCSLCMRGKYLLSFSINGKGIIGNEIMECIHNEPKLFEDYQKLADFYGQSFEETYFYEEMYNIICVEDFKRRFMLKPRKLRIGDENNIPNEHVKIFTDIDLRAFNGFNKFVN